MLFMVDMDENNGQCILGIQMADPSIEAGVQEYGYVSQIPDGKGGYFNPGNSIPNRVLVWAGKREGGADEGEGAFLGYLQRTADNQFSCCATRRALDINEAFRMNKYATAMQTSFYSGMGEAFPFIDVLEGVVNVEDPTKEDVFDIGSHLLYRYAGPGEYAPTMRFLYLLVTRCRQGSCMVDKDTVKEVENSIAG